MRGKKLLYGLAAAVFWLAVWQAAAAAVDMELLVPKPLTVLLALMENARTMKFWLSVLYSLLRILAGFAAGVALGVVLAAATRLWTAADVLLSPMLRVIRATPVASFIILALLWIRSGILPAFISMLMVIPVVWANVYEGIGAVDKGLLEVGEVFHFSPGKKLRLIYAPSLRPYFKASAVTSLGMAWKSGIAAEVLCQPKMAIGTGLYYSKLYIETQDLFAWTAVVIILSLIVEKVLVRLLKRM